MTDETEESKKSGRPPTRAERKLAEREQRQRWVWSVPPGAIDTTAHSTESPGVLPTVSRANTEKIVANNKRRR